MLREIGHCFKDLDKFWAEEICRAMKALEISYVDPGDASRLISSKPLSLGRYGPMLRSLQKIHVAVQMNEQGSHIQSTVHKHNNLPSSSVRPFALPHFILLLTLHRALTLRK